MRIVDLTRPIRTGPPPYPGDPPIVVHKWATIREDGYYMNLLIIGEHTGTHLDAPAHFIEGGETVDRVPVDRLVAPAVAVDARGVEEIGLDTVRRGLERAGEGYWLVIVAGYNGGRYPPLTVEAAGAIVDSGIAGVALDTPSPDYPPYPVHRLLLSNGVLIVENLASAKALLEAGRFTLIVAPMKVEGGSGAPARVLALLE